MTTAATAATTTTAASRATSDPVPGPTPPGEAVSSSRQIKRAPLAVTVVCASAALLALMVVSVSIGPLRIDLADVGRILLAGPNGWEEAGLNQRDASVVWQLRVPRILLGGIVGASLAISGAALQSLFTNPLADPGIVGVTSGASAGAVAAIVLAGSAGASVTGALGAWLVPLGAFASGLAVTLLIYVLARPGRTSGTSRMLLVGIAVGSACQAVVGFFTYIADDAALQTLVFWQMGSLGKVNWAQLITVAPVFVIGLILVLSLAKTLDVLTLGERQAQHLGLIVKRSRLLVIIMTALLTASAVAFAGSIGFVGLVVPHIMRFLVGPGHRALLPISALAGAVLVVAADAAARTLNPPSEIPIGLFTAAVGAPFFLFLILREKRSIW